MRQTLAAIDLRIAIPRKDANERKVHKAVPPCVFALLCFLARNLSFGPIMSKFNQ